jgi:hypothetical protein
MPVLADEVIQAQNRNKTVSELREGAVFNEVWEVIYNTVGLLDAGIGLYQLPNTIRGLQNFVLRRRAIFRLGRMKAKSFGGRSLEMLNTWAKLKGTNGAGKAFNHVPTSGALVTNNAKQGTFLVGSFQDDLTHIIDELGPYPKIETVDFNFPVPSGQKFNLLNISDAQYNYWAANGGFFRKVNGPWIDASVSQGADIIVVSDFSKVYKKVIDSNLNERIEITGFGKELHRLEWKHGYRFDPATKMMVPPSKAKGLPTITKLSDYIHN